MITSIYFDIDGTLIDIKAAQNKACSFLYQYGHFDDVTDEQSFTQTWDRLTEYHYDFYTRKEISYAEQRRRRITDLYATYNQSLAGADPLTVYGTYLAKFEDSWHIYDDVLPCLKGLASAGYRLGIITNGDKAQQRQKLEKTNIVQYFTDIVAGGDYEFSKPDARIFEVACASSGVDYGSMCYVGDDLSKDITPCNVLGIKSILIDRTEREYNNPDLLRIQSLSEINLLLEPNGVTEVVVN